MRKLKKKAKRRLMAFIVVGIVVLAGGMTFLFLNKDSKDITSDPKDEGNTAVETPVKKVQVIDLESDSRPYAVMINNNSAVWKYQSGMNDAYLVYEMLVEGGITREMALFKDKDTAKIQSVRSSRHYFLDYALENDAIYVHWGWSPKAQSDISSLKINNINGLTYEGTYFFRDSSIKGIGSEHKGYTTMEKLKAAAARLKYRTTTDNKSLLTYDAEHEDMSGLDGVVDAKYIEIPYSSGYTAKFYYDEQTKEYKRSQNKTELVDYTSKERVTTHNIIVYNVGYTTIDNYGRQDMKNIGSGTGYYISEGKAIPIKWEKKTRSGKTNYMYANGEELIVNDGRTYIGLQPNGKSVKISAQLPA